MKYLSIILLISLAACTKPHLDAPAKHWYYDFTVYQDQSTRYQLQRFNGSTWDVILNVPDSSKTGTYHILLNVNDGDIIRNAAIQGTEVTYFPELRAK